MFKFNNDNVFTGYLKQLLHDFNLPKYRVYTKEQAYYAKNRKKYLEKYLKDKKLALTQSCETLKNLIEKWYKAKDELEKSVSKKMSKAAKEAITAKKVEITTTIENLNKSLKEIENKLNNLTIETIASEIPEELNVIETVYHNKIESYPAALDEKKAIKYPLRMHYAPYIKEGLIQEYVNGTWHKCHATLNYDHSKVHRDNSEYLVQPYTYGQKILNYTKNLRIQNNIYDSYTHEYLGDYLRFQRDYNNINLMPLYNCFSNRACPNLKIEFKIDDYLVQFNTDQSFNTTLYKYYMLPVKFFKDYTIAIECEAAVELCCCIYGAYQNLESKFEKIPALTYQCLSDSQFSKPILYSKIKNLNNLLNKTSETKLAQYESDLKLILKIPANNKSSIVILEGNYTTYNQSYYTDEIFETDLKEEELTTLLNLNITLDELEEIQTKIATNKINSTQMKRQLSNHTVINFKSDQTIEYAVDKLITPLQLLRLNTGESYPFADRLVEYLLGNAITLNEEIEDNVIRLKTVANSRCPDELIDYTNGVWEPKLQALIYNYVNRYTNTHDINHDILGFVDKDVEKLYSTSDETLLNIDIYNKKER